MTPETASMLRSAFAESMSKGQGGDHGQRRAAKDGENPKPHDEVLDSEPQSTSAAIAKATGVSKATVERDVQLGKALDKLGIDRKGQGGNHGSQFGRRNLSPYERTRLALRLEEAIKERAKANMVKGTNQHSPKQNSAEASNPIETREEIAKLAGVSRARNHGAGHERRDRRHRGVESLLQPDCVWRRTGMGRLFRIKAV